jgi:hypothetical protein
MSNCLLFCSANVVWVIEPIRMRWGGHYACVKKSLLLDFRRWGSLKNSELLQDRDVDGRAILNLSSWNKLRGMRGVVWIDLVQDRGTWIVLVNAVMNRRVANSAGNCLNS